MNNQSRIEALSRAYVISGSQHFMEPSMLQTAMIQSAKLEQQLSENEILQASDLADMEEARLAE